MSSLTTKHGPLAASLCFATALLPWSLQAQTQAAGDLEEVIVTGYRASSESALEEKKQGNGVVDVIKAEDIADFPDSNLAESIQRVPGVSISRVGGEGKAITVRGLNPGFTHVRINGMEAQSGASGTVSDRGANLSRGFDFNVFASELFNSIAVRKTTSTEIVEGSLGATVDLTTARPFDLDGLTFVTNLQGIFNDLSDDTKPKASALLGNTWADGRFGALVSAAYAQRRYFEEEFGSGGWNPATIDGGFCTPVGRLPQTPDTDAVRGSNALNRANGVLRPAATDTALNVVAEFTPDLFGRFSVARVMSRPEIAFLTPGGGVNLTGTPGVTSGNPFLNPILATTSDLSMEWYFAESSLLGVGLFYKDIGSYIQNQSQQMSFRQTGLPIELLAGTNLDPDNTPFTVSRPVNTPGGPLKGVEVNYQQAFRFLPGWLGNFGALPNYTYVESEIEYFLAQSASTTTRDDLLGLSKNAWNATLYWENERLSARISGTYRDEFLEALPVNNPLQDVEGTDEMTTFDASISFNVNDQFKLTFEALNLFDEYKRQYIDSDRDSTFVYGHVGRQFSVGVQYRS